MIESLENFFRILYDAEAIEDAVYHAFNKVEIDATYRKESSVAIKKWIDYLDQ